MASSETASSDKDLKVSIKRLDSKALFVTQCVADATIGPHKLRLDTIIPNGSILVSWDNERYMVSMRDVIDVIAASKGITIGEVTTV